MTGYKVLANGRRLKDIRYWPMVEDNRISGTGQW